MVKILDGRIVRDRIAAKLKTLNSELKIKPKLVIIQVGNLAQSNTYIRQKVLFGGKIGATITHKRFDEKITQKELISHLSALNSQADVHGIIVQLPLPKHFDKDRIIDSITPEKDIDGLTSRNLKLLWENKSEGYTPATTKGILTLLDYYKIPIEGKKVVIVGRSSLVGKPTFLAFVNRNATVTLCHKKTRNLKQETRNADILVVAAGKPHLITKDHVTKNQVVIDVGINVINHKPSSTKEEGSKPETEISQKKLVGDTDFDSVKSKVSAISPVPGGVGPMTVASLFENLLEAYNRQSKKQY